MVIDGDLNEFTVIQLPDELTGALFGPDITRVYIGTREGCLSTIADLELDRRGVSYDLRRQGESPMWTLALRLTQGLDSDDPSDPGWETNIEAPIEILWRLTDERTSVDYRNVGRFERMMDVDLTSDERRELNAHLEALLAGKATPSPTWFGDKPPDVLALIQRMEKRFERGKNTTFMHMPVMVRDASFRKEANYRAKIDAINTLYTSEDLQTLYPEIPTQIKDRMPTNGEWKVTMREWSVESNGQGRETLSFTWAEWNDPEDVLEFVMPP